MTGQTVFCFELISWYSIQNQELKIRYVASLNPRTASRNLRSKFMITRLIGVALIIAGIGLAFWGHQISETLTVQLTFKVTGSLPDEVMYRYIAGAASGIVGLLLILKG